MRVVRLLSLAITAWLVLAGISACASLRGPELIVDFGPAADQCAIRGITMNCEEVPLYLKNKLSLPLDTYVAVRNLQEVPSHEVMGPVIEAIEAAGYESVIGVIEL